ncbi:hypothetical protein [uncultured Jannaschia sp.]|uniref:hypothetical protein n=1 Tax=uncultured Jannaschia sp. TaxID=293347 RepID=UPI0026138CB0|nr:hypothetical protein [uncultured Jannaschia sp.]
MEFIGPPAVGKSFLISMVAKQGNLRKMRLEAGASMRGQAISAGDLRVAAQALHDVTGNSLELNWQDLETGFTNAARQLNYLKEDALIRQMSGAFLLDETGLFRKFRPQVQSLLSQGRPEDLDFLRRLLARRVLVHVVAAPETISDRLRDRALSGEKSRDRRDVAFGDELSGRIQERLDRNERFIQQIAELGTGRFIRVDTEHDLAGAAADILRAMKT